MEFSGISMEFSGISMGFHAISLGFHGISMGFHGISWDSFSCKPYVENRSETVDPYNDPCK
jgi:hypothetical protein